MQGEVPIRGMKLRPRFLERNFRGERYLDRNRGFIRNVTLFVRENDTLIFTGTKADLWNTVSPKMAQRVFSGMLNESLSIITTRFIHVRPRYFTASSD